MDCSVRGILYDLIKHLRPFFSVCISEIVVKMNLPLFPVLVRRLEKSQKYFNVLVMKQKLIHSNQSSSLVNPPKDAMFHSLIYCRLKNTQGVKPSKLQSLLDSIYCKYTKHEHFLYLCTPWQNLLLR